MATILVVDDEAHMRRLVSYILESAGHRVLAAPEGQTALAYLDDESQSIDLVFADIAMPGMDGFELLGTIRSHDRWRHLPVVVLTAQGQDRDLNRALSTGADDFITKPFSSSQLLAAVRSLVPGA
ncbi:MAG: response regulator [Chloroflexota bacterium]